MDSPCTHIYSALSNSPLTLRDLDEIGLDRINEAKEKKKAALENFGIQSVLDLLETYPRRYIDRTNMITIADLEPGVPALVIVTVLLSWVVIKRTLPADHPGIRSPRVSELPSSS